MGWKPELYPLKAHAVEFRNSEHGLFACQPRKANESFRSRSRETTHEVDLVPVFDNEKMESIIMKTGYRIPVNLVQTRTIELHHHARLNPHRTPLKC
jgi:hypothetical protein